MHSKINSLKDNLKIVTKQSSSSIIESAAEITEIEFHIYAPVTGGFGGGGKKEKRKHRKVKVNVKVRKKRC